MCIRDRSEREVGKVFQNCQGLKTFRFDFFDVWKLRVTRMEVEAKAYHCVGSVNWSGVEYEGREGCFWSFLLKNFKAGFRGGDAEAFLR